MSSFCGFIVAISLFLALPLSIILLIILLIKRKRIKPAIISILLSVFAVILFTILGTMAFIISGEYKNSITSPQQESNIAENAISKVEPSVEPTSIPTPTPAILFSVTPKSAEITKKPSISAEDEENFKNSCIEVVYNDLNDEWIGKSVTKEILFTSSMKSNYKCASTESYIEDYSDYQHVYAIYDISDCRFDKSFPIYSNDVIRIYGIITDIKINYANGLYYPIIDMYYADYIREWGKAKYTQKSIEELIRERNVEQEQIAVENEYYNSLNSDYTGKTKNIDNMEALNENEFKEKCDCMNFRNMVDSTEDLSGRYVKIHVQLNNHKVFTSEAGKQTRLNDLVDTYSINNNVWLGKLLYERTGEYGGDLFYLYFVDNDTYNIDEFKKEQELTVYGMILNYDINKGFHNEFDFLVIYIE